VIPIKNVSGQDRDEAVISEGHSWDEASAVHEQNFSMSYTTKG